MATSSHRAAPAGECCQFPGAGRFVPGEGPKPARVMIIGQNPGAQEDAQGRPFVGASGRFLNAILKRNGLSRDEIYITNVVKCKTPANRKPLQGEINACMPQLLAEIKEVKPRLIILMGEVAQQTPREEGILYLETYHPAAAVRFPFFRQKFEQDFARVKGMLGEE